MARQRDLIDHFADLVTSVDDPRRLAERTLEVITSLLRARGAAVFSREREGFDLFASRGSAPSASQIQTVWSLYRRSLERGRCVLGPSGADARFSITQKQRAGKTAFTLVPILEAEVLVALLYVDEPEFDLAPHPCGNHRLEALLKFPPILAKALAESVAPSVRTRSERKVRETYLERTPVKDMERDKLLLLLSRHQWNIARVARLMGVGRRTIYLRLEEYQIPRQHVRKRRLRPDLT